MSEPAAAPAKPPDGPQATVHLVMSSSNEPGSPNDVTGRPTPRGRGTHASAAAATGQRDPLHRHDSYSTTSEFIAWAEKVRRDHMLRHDAYLQHAATLERGIKSSSNWPWALDRITTARRASRPLRQNAGAEQDAARRISASVRVLTQMKDAPRARTRGFDPTR